MSLVTYGGPSLLFQKNVDILTGKTYSVNGVALPLILRDVWRHEISIIDF